MVVSVHETMKKLRLSPDFQLPLDVATTTIAVLGIRNSGKTNTCVVLTEELLDAGQQVVVIDPTDVWWGLKSSKDGKSAGYPVVVFGGRHGDVPLTAADGPTVADFIVEERLPAILSLRHFESIGDQRRFVTEFARRLYHRKGEEGRDTPMLLVVDEAHLFVPQRVGAAEAPMVGAMQKLVRQGRSSGIGVAIIDQRAASVNKDVLTQIELLICHRTTSPHDSRALEDWIEQNDTEDQRAEFLKKLPGLAQGTAWCWSPGWLKVFELVAVRGRRTFDSSATPKAGEKRVTPTTLAHVDLDALKRKMVEAIEKASAEDPKVLRAKIADLERALAGRAVFAAPTLAPAPEVLVPWLAAGNVAQMERYIEQLAEARRSFEQAWEEFDEKTKLALGAFHAWLSRVKEPRPLSLAKGIPSALPRRALDAKPSNGASARPSPKPNGEGVPSSSPAEKKILHALAQGGAMSRKKLAIWTGYSFTSGSFGQALADLRAAGGIDGPSSAIIITKEGKESIAGETERLPTGRALLDWWVSKRPKSDGDVLKILADHGRAMSREDLAQAADRSNTSGSFGQTLADLRKLGLIDGPSKAICISPQLVEES